MIKHNQNTQAGGVVVVLVLTIVVLIGVLAFAGWAFSSRQDYKNNADAKSAVAAEKARAQESAAKDAQFAEESKNPLKTYTGPEAYGSLIVNYPKTWSGYVSTGSSGSSPLDGYFNIGVVPSTSDQNSVFSLRVQIVDQPYDEVLKDFTQPNSDNPTTITAYSLPKVPKVVGVKISGGIQNNKTGTMVILPLRSTTLQIWSEGTAYQNDFNTYILPNLSFSP